MQIVGYYFQNLQSVWRYVKTCGFAVPVTLHVHLIQEPFPIEN